MTNIYKVPQYSQRFVEYSLEDEDTFTHEFTITDNMLSYKLYTASEPTPALFDFSISLEEFKASPRFTEQCFFALNESFIDTSGNQIISKMDGHKTFDRNSVINLLDYTAVGKHTRINQESTPGWRIPFNIFVNSTSDTFTTMEYTLHVPTIDDQKQHSTVVKLNGSTYTLLEPKFWTEFISPITATTTSTTVNEGDTITVNVTTDQDIHFVYLEKVVGSIDKTKVKITDGAGSFNMSTDGLSAGEELEVKIGFKSYSNVTTFKKLIS